MTTLEEVKHMQQQGFGDEQIIQNLRDRGIDYKDIADALAQSRIKAAVEQPDTDPSSIYPGGAPTPSGEEGMQPSIMSQQPEDITPPTPGSGYASMNQYNVQQPQEYSAAQYQEGAYSGGYSASPDLTTEIAEQVVTEKLTELRKHLEKIADMKTTVEARIEYIDERLKRMEKMMDTLQTSVLRKVGDYVTNVEDIKREMIETQKTFAKILPSKQKAEHHPSHSHGYHKK